MTHEKSFNTNQNPDHQKVQVEFDSLHDFNALNSRQQSDLRRNLEKDKRK